MPKKQITTLAEWKRRLVVGAQVRQIYNFHEGQNDHIFTVTKVQTNGIYAMRSDMEKRSWMEFPKREEIQFTDNGWRRINQPRPGKTGVFLVAEYEWIETE